MQEYNSRDLLQKWKDGTLTEHEKMVLESWYLTLAKGESNLAMDDQLERFLEETENSTPIDHIITKQRTFRPSITKYGIAASILLCCLFGYFLLTKYYLYSENNAPAIAHLDILPGDNRAMLISADGSKITLDNAADGEIIKENGTSVIKTGDGKITYQNNLQIVDSDQQLTIFNTISTPKAGQYMVTLSDGTKVWLNAASSVRFPVMFSAKERVIEVVGEVFLDVKKWKIDGKHVPFKVISGSQVVEVLGTKFNINNYSDEGNIKTTLLEGSIKLKIDGSTENGILLKPGEQARIDIKNTRNAQSTKPKFQISDVDPSAVVAWKEGYFLFDNIGLPELMRQIARWYDMEVEYEGEIQEYEFVGEIPRETKLSTVLNILESGGVNFRVEGRKIIVTK